MHKRLHFASLAAIVAIVIGVTQAAVATTGNVRLTNDVGGGYISAYTLATGIPYTDNVISECAISRGRQNEPSVAIDPRNTSVILGSSNDYCGVYQPFGSATPSPIGPIWLGYYRSENGGASFVSSLVPGYPGDTSPYAALAQIRTASSGDPVIAWDNHGRAFFASEASGDPAGTKKTFGDEWIATFDNKDGENGATVNDGKRFVGSVTVAKGSSAPNLLGVFNDKTAIEADRTGGSCDGNVYFAWSRFTGNQGSVAIYLVRSIDHGATWSNPLKLSSAKDVQFPDIAVTGNGHVYVTWRVFAAQAGEQDSIQYAKSTDCGNTFAPSATIRTIDANDAVDVSTPLPTPTQSASDDPLIANDVAAAGSLARDCGDFGAACQSGYTFFRRDTQVRSTADQKDTSTETIYLVYDGTKAGTEVPTGTTYGTNGPGTAGVARTFFFRLNGATGMATTPKILSDPASGHQVFPDISVDGGTLFAIWWDSRNDPAYSVTRPIGNDASGLTTASLDVFWTTSTNRGGTWTTASRLTDTTTNPNFEQFSNRTVPFAGDYLWVSSVSGTAYAVWTDWRNTVAGQDPREATTNDSDGLTADVVACRTNTGGVWSGDRCPHAGGIDQNIYGSSLP
jgi:hypothetical protein